MISEEFFNPLGMFLRTISVYHGTLMSTRREMIHYRQKENPFVKILLMQNEYRLEKNIFLLRQKINFFVKWIIFQQYSFLLEQEEIILTAKSRLFSFGANAFHLPQMDLSVRAGDNFLANHSMRRKFHGTWELFRPTEHVFQDYFGVLPNPHA